MIDEQEERRHERDERRKTLERRALSARVVHEALRSEGKAELERSSSALAWSGLAAGISMGLSLMAEGVLRAHLPDATWTGLVASLGYTFGFVAVTLGRQHIFTETTLTACLPLLHARTWVTFLNVLRFWVVVLLSNLAGAAVFAWAASHESAFGPEHQAAFATVSLHALEPDAASLFVRGVFGGWIIALMVWLLPSAEAARLWVIVLMTYLIAAADLAHVIAGSVDVFYAIASGGVPWTAYPGYFVPVFVGNSIGGIVFVALLNHAQVIAGASTQEPPSRG